MTKKEPYGIKKDIKVLEGSSKRHKARLVGQFPGLIPTPELPIPEREGRNEKRRRRAGGGEVKDPEILIDLDAEDLEMDMDFKDLVLTVLGLDPSEADFDVIMVTEKVLRALAKAKFSNLAQLKFNDRIIYERPEEEMDLRTVLKDAKDFLLSGEDIQEAMARVIDGGEGDTEAEVVIKRVHTGLTHDIKIDVTGSLEEEYLNRIINYLEENLEIEDLLER